MSLRRADNFLEVLAIVERRLFEALALGQVSKKYAVI
jgi:hypothetical protein